MTHRDRSTGIAGDSGSTLVELMVAMVIMTVAGAIFTTAVVTLSRTTNQAQAIGDSAQQTNQAFQTLDRTVRYASAITTPGRTATGWWVELSDTTTGTEVCTQLRTDLATRQLQRRSWTPTGATTSVGLSGWTPLASGLTNAAAAVGADTQPITAVVPASTAVHQQLQFRLVAEAGPGSARRSAESRFTLVAVNSAADASTSSVCQQVPRS